MTLRSAAALCLLLAAAACGQKGPLYLPGDPEEGRIVLPEELGGEPRENAGEEDRDDEADEAKSGENNDGAGADRDEQ